MELSVLVYRNNSWRHVGCRAKRSMNSIILEPGVKDLLLEDARDFLDSKNWYAERGIPFRRGYLLVRCFVTSVALLSPTFFSSYSMAFLVRGKLH